ncbi:SusD/RagB family nutrient-binding outer membrane lipoprotein [Chitinophaga japonensis]|uniref:SusD-like starch-binding protein associating with outer membrane n=1 Tax=Chitinophaga japonensis TaxID=104662 RepID=A0A562TBN2_CHIJA|nr:SusD/RagB family nutrient-binding outer membrane lipoprotein [Chitinophaga japonensis]TWI90942.1 SusD-like starch-binding protein associating with outer membrane [Chitinophaga japonensis]
MNKIIHKITGIVLTGSILLSSCTKDFQEINTDPNNTPSAQPSQLLAPALVSTLTYNMIRNRNFNNELMQVTVDPNDAEGRVFRYDFRSNWSDYLYNGWYSELTNFKDIYKIAGEQLTFNESYQGISLICQSWVYSMLTDTYGDVPYFQSNLAKDSTILEPVFDRQRDIYMDIFKKLEAANTLLARGTGITASSDPVYYGDVAKWRRFGNSLYLRLLLRISGKTEVADTCIAKIREIVDEKASTYPIISNNDESAILRWTGVGPFVSPYLSVREQDFRSPGIATFFIEHLVNWNDPRIDIPTYGTGTPTKINRWGIAPYQGAYLGIPSGYAPGDNPVKKSYFYSTSANSGAGPTLQTDPLTGMMMNYAEVQFILAEAALKGWISGDAGAYYTNGALNSITLWLPQWDVPIEDFLAASDIQWVESMTPEEKMERIHLQKYYALFLTDMQQWFEYRRTGHPILPKGPGLRNNGVMPARMTYPVYVQSTNPTNYKAAVAAQGPDVISTEVWWQKP